jgi:hypothetical protein
MLSSLDQLELRDERMMVRKARRRPPPPLPLPTVAPTHVPTVHSPRSRALLSLSVCWACAARRARPPPSARALTPYPVLIGHAVSLTPY